MTVSTLNSPLAVKTLVYSTKPYDHRYFETHPQYCAEMIDFLEARLTPHTVKLAAGYPAVCLFTNDDASADILATLKAGGTELVALRCAGYNNVDLDAAKDLGMTVVRVPEYSPYAVAEHTIALMLGLNRRLHKAYNRVREGNFSLEGLMGFDLHGKTVGIVGTGKIGAITAGILQGFGCQVLAYDPYPNSACQSRGIKYVELNELLAQSHIVSLHCPLTPESFHLMNKERLALMKPNAMLINTSRGGLIDTVAVVEALKSERLGSLGIDVYEEESELFFENLSDQVIQDDVFSRLLTFPNVMITGHQAFFTHEAMTNIAQVTLDNIVAYGQGEPKNQVT